MAWLGRAIYVVAVGIKERLGWPAKLGYGDWVPSKRQLKHLCLTSCPHSLAICAENLVGELLPLI
jgi:hypothetical protein